MNKKSGLFFIGFMAGACCVLLLAVTFGANSDFDGFKDEMRYKIDGLHEKSDKIYDLSKRHFHYSFSCMGCPLDFVKLQEFVVELNGAAAEVRK